MRKTLFFLAIILMALGGISVMAADPLEELMENFDKDYNAIKPPSEYSSVNSDYKLGQAALGTMYTTRAIGLLYRQNQQLLEKYEEMLQKYDKVIEQNREIIRLLSSIVKNQKKNGKEEVQTQNWSH